MFASGKPRTGAYVKAVRGSRVLPAAPKSGLECQPQMAGASMADMIKPAVGGIMQRLIDYRNKAEELRTISEDMIVPDLKQTLRRIALEYDTMARTLAQMHDVREPLP